MNNKDSIKSFTQLEVWQQGHALVLLVYKVTEDFPKKEMYSLVDQLRSAAISITSNIAEGFSRNSNKEKLQFYYMSRGSLTELQNQLLVARDVKYISDDAFKEIAEQAVRVDKLINGCKETLK